MMSRHQISATDTNIFSKESEISMPLNMSKFRQYRDTQAGTARAGVAMAVMFCLFLIVGLCGMYVSPMKFAFEVEYVLLNLFAIALISLAVWPLLRLVKARTKILSQGLPALVISREGVTDNCSSYVFGFIPWSKIDLVTVASRRSRNLNKDFTGIAVVVKNKNVLLQRKPGLTGLWLNLEPEITNRRQIFVPQDRIAMPAEEVVEQINAFRARMNV